MTSRRKVTKPTLPRFESDEAFVRFVETHDLADLWESFEEVPPIELESGLAQAIDRRARRKRLD